MYIFGVLNQCKNAMQMLWSNKKIKHFLIYAIVFFFLGMYITSTLNSMIRRERLTLPPAIENIISSIYAQENLEYQKRMKERELQRQMQQQSSQQRLNQNIQQQNMQNRDNQKSQPKNTQDAISQKNQQNTVQQVANQRTQQTTIQQAKGGYKTIFTPAGALVLIAEIVAMSAICCFVIYLIYKRFTVDTIPPLPVLSNKGKIDEEYQNN